MIVEEPYVQLLVLRGILTAPTRKLVDNKPAFVAKKVANRVQAIWVIVTVRRFIVTVTVSDVNYLLPGCGVLRHDVLGSTQDNL